MRLFLAVGQLIPRSLGKNIVCTDSSKPLHARSASLGRYQLSSRYSLVYSMFIETSCQEPFLAT